MTLEIRQLIVRAVVQSPADSASTLNEAELVARCTRAVLRQLARLKER